MSDIEPQPDTSFLAGVLRATERTLGKDPVLMFGVIVDILLASLAFFLSGSRTTLLLSVVGVSALALLVWRFKRHSSVRRVTIANGRDVLVRNSVNDSRSDRGETSLTITDGAGVTVDNSLNSDESRPHGRSTDGHPPSLPR